MPSILRLQVMFLDESPSSFMPGTQQYSVYLFENIWAVFHLRYPSLLLLLSVLLSTINCSKKSRFEPSYRPQGISLFVQYDHQIDKKLLFSEHTAYILVGTTGPFIKCPRLLFHLR